MENRFNEEIRQLKLFKIQETEAKLRHYTEAYNSIKENVIIKFTKNSTSHLLRIVIGCCAILLLFVALIGFFPEQFNSLISSLSDVQMDQEVKQSFADLKFFFLGSAILFWFVGYLLKINIQKRNSIYSLSKLLEEVMDNMEASVNDDKRKYEYFVDNLAEQEQIRRRATKQSTV